jgi:cell wall-associated NlpC family hydrolase
MDRLETTLRRRFARFTAQDRDKARTKTKHKNKEKEKEKKPKPKKDKQKKVQTEKSPPAPPPVSPPGVTPFPPPPPPPAGSRFETFLACLRHGVGGRYCLPAREPDCTDCSGLVRRCYRQATGIDIGGDSHEQFKLGVAIARGDVQPGDLLFWDTMNGREFRGGNAASHVGVASGGNRMINALNEELGIRDSDLGSDYWTNQVVFLGARRLKF